MRNSRGRAVPGPSRSICSVILETKLGGISRTALQRFAARAQRAAGVRGPVSVLVTGGREVRRLNHKFRGKDEPTDVLSFPAEDNGGDIAISAGIARRQGARLGHSAAEEVKVLILHGMLHLAGHDHERDSGRMARLEERLRRRLGLPVALIARNRGAGGPA